MTAADKTYTVQRALASRGIAVSFEDAETFRRAEMTLSNWGELECGGGNDYASWSIERDETTGKPFRVTYPHEGQSRRRRIADREAGALRRVANLCKTLGVHYFHQADPRGVSLYVGKEPMTDQSYSGQGVAIYGGA